MMKTWNRFTLLTSLILVSTNVFATIIDDLSNTLPNPPNKTMEHFLGGFTELSPNLSNVIALYNSGETIKAKDMIATILSENPSNPNALHVAGVIFLQEKRYENAQVAFEGALRSGGQNPSVLSKLGVTRLLKGDREKGLKILNLAISLNPNEILALRYLAWLAKTDGQYNEEVSYLLKLLEISKPKNLSELHVSLAKAYSATGRYDAAIKVLEPNIANQSKSSAGLKSAASTLLIDSYIQTNQFMKASSLLSKASKNNQISAVQTAVFKIELPIRMKQFNKALGNIDKAVSSDPKNEHIYRYAASQGFSGVMENNLAIKQLTAVVKFLEKGKDKNRFSSALNDLVALYIKAERKIDALRVVQGYAEKYPYNTKLLYQLAELQTASRQLESAKNNLDKLLKKDPKYTSAYYLKGIIARREHEFSTAEKWFTKVNKMDPKFENAWVQRSGNLIDAGNPKKALDTLTLATKENKTSALLWFELGALLTHLERHEEAIPAYKAVLGYAPDHLPSIDNLAGSLLILEKDVEEALYFAEKAYRMNPPDKVLQLNYLEALLLNKKYKPLLKEAKKLEPGLNSLGRFHYFVGASYLKNGDKNKGIQHLKIAARDNKLEDRYSQKVSNLLNP